MRTPAAASDSEVEDLLGVVFPHADATRNTPTARYVHSDGEEAPAGSFVTVFTEGGVDVLCVARFLVAEDGPPLEPVAVEGWALADGDRASGMRPVGASDGDEPRHSPQYETSPGRPWRWR